MYQVILNADDLGFSSSVNRAILLATSNGTLTAASLMVNMPFAEEAVKAIHESCADLSLGLHFCLTSGRSVAGAGQVPLLVNSNSCFRHGFLGIWRLLCSQWKKEVLEQIRIEFLAQLERMDLFASRYSLQFDHLDSHQHIHVFPDVFDMMEGEAQKRNLVLRIPRERFGLEKRIWQRFFAWFPSGLLKKGILDYHLRKRTQAIEYYGILDTGKMDLWALQSIFDTLIPGKVYEINIHPSEKPLPQEYQTEDSCAGDVEFYRSPWRQREYAALLDPALKTMIEQNEVQLVGFQQVSERIQ